MSTSDDVDRPIFAVGDRWFIRTVTYHLVGEVTQVRDGFLRLKDAAWVADTERFTQAIGQGALKEVEPVGDAVVNTAAITDAFPWRHDLPLRQI